MRPHFALLALFAAAAAPRALAQPGFDAPPESARLANALAQAIGTPKGVRVALAVYDADSAAPLFRYHAGDPLKPASVLKLLTTAAALERLGPDFRFETDFFLRDEELIIRGSGDPGLGDERLAQRAGKPRHFELSELAQALKARGVTRLRTIALDDSIFDQQWRSPQWDPNQHQAWYQAPVGGINFNDNCLDAAVAIRAGAAQLTLRPPLPPDFFVNRLSLGKKHAPLVRRDLQDDLFQFFGSVARDGALEPIAVNQPTVFAGHAIAQSLRESGIEVSGSVVRRSTRALGLALEERVYVHATPLADAIWRANNFSQNVFAECLLKSLAAYAPDGSRTEVAGSWDAGVRALRATVATLGVDLRGAEIDDGSGLGHGNRLSADQIARLLTAMRRSPHAELFAASLARPGEDGTLRSRLNAPALRGKLRAKTGTISGVHALAGYATRADGRVLAFALLVNGAPPKDFELKICRALVAL